MAVTCCTCCVCCGMLCVCCVTSIIIIIVCVFAFFVCVCMCVSVFVFYILCVCVCTCLWRKNGMDNVTYATPRGGKSALFGISFDGDNSGVSTRSLCPLCVSVLNFDEADPLACGLVGYVPYLDVSKAFRLKVKHFVLAKCHVIQRCVGAVLDVLQ